MLEIAAVSCQVPNINLLGQAGRVAFPEGVRENTGFHEKNLRELCFLAKSEGNSFQEVRVDPVDRNHPYTTFRSGFYFEGYQVSGS